MTAPLLPVLAIARTGMRRVALVLLDRRKRVRCARTLDLRRHKGVAARLDAVRRVVSRLVEKENVAVLALEAETSRSPSPPGFRELLAGICDAEAVWMQERQVASVFRAAGSDGTRAVMIAEVAAEYRELAGRLDFRRQSLYRDRDHERDVRPLVHAFLLAHTVACEALRAASARAA